MNKSLFNTYNKSLHNCRTKTHKKNVFDTYEIADKMAKKMRVAKQESTIVAYLCPHCDKYHLGRNKNYNE